MPKIAYDDMNLRSSTLATIHKANAILESYTAQGFKLTLRQLYYQFVSRDLIPNNMREYKKLGSAVNDGRLCGYIDWDHIEDRTRELEKLPHWDNPADVIDSAARGYNIDLWKDQPYRVEVWIEKDALAGVIEPTCEAWDVPFLSCRGYTSSSEMWTGAMRMLKNIIENEQKIIVLHLGDHDPSGIDMTRDINDRLFKFIGTHLAGQKRYGGRINGHQFAEHFELKRIALNWDQVEEYEPPPNPAKLTDTRAREYVARFGEESWELDALEPTILAGLIETNVQEVIDEDKWDDAIEQQRRDREHLIEVSDRWDKVEELIEG